MDDAAPRRPPYGIAAGSALERAAEQNPTLMTAVEGLVPLYLLDLAGVPQGEWQQLAERCADTVTAHGDDLMFGAPHAARRSTPSPEAWLWERCCRAASPSPAGTGALGLTRAAVGLQDDVPGSFNGP